jgi:hypothetical protein
MARIAAGGWVAFSVDSEGQGYSWGDSVGGQLGVPGLRDSYIPKRVVDPLDPGITRGARAMTEYLNDRIGQGHYFITSSFQEAQGIDAGAAGAGWARTGRSWRAWSVAPRSRPASRRRRFTASMRPARTATSSP